MSIINLDYKTRRLSELVKQLRDLDESDVYDRLGTAAVSIAKMVAEDEKDPVHRIVRDVLNKLFTEGYLDFRAPLQDRVDGAVRQVAIHASGEPPQEEP